MHTPATIKKHPLHPMLITFPIGLFGFSLLSDIISLLGWGGNHWHHVAFYTLGGGIAFALVAALPGLIDLLSIESPALKRKGMIHAAAMLLAVGIFAVDFFLRMRVSPESKLPLLLSIIGVAVMSAGGWIGAELVHHFGVGVDEDAIRHQSTTR